MGYYENPMKGNIMFKIGMYYVLGLALGTAASMSMSKVLTKALF